MGQPGLVGLGLAGRRTTGCCALWFRSRLAPLFTRFGGRLALPGLRWELCASSGVCVIKSPDRAGKGSIAGLAGLAGQLHAYLLDRFRGRLPCTCYLEAEWPPSARYLEVERPPFVISLES